MSTIKSRRVFQLRKTTVRQSKPEETQKTVNINKQDDSQINNSFTNNLSINKQDIINNNSQISKISDRKSIKAKQQKQQKLWVPLYDGPELVISNNQLFFKDKINTIQVKNIQLKNIGSSSIYFELKFRNKPKISSSAIKDPKPKFFCHYQPSVIQPGQQMNFSFSFISEIPGVFIEQCEVICRPEINTTIPPIKLKGQAFINDKFLENRMSFKDKLAKKAQSAFVKEVVQDIIHQVKSPQPPLPDVKIPQIAEELFEKRNWSKGLFYNKKVHSWFDGLFRQAYRQVHQQDSQMAYWDQSVETLSQLINKVEDEVLKESFLLRLDNYSHISSTPPKATNKNDLFESIRTYLLETGLKVGGQLTDQAKKQLEMWQIPFEQPKQQQNQEELNARKQENNKIKAQWAKKMKKKKWGEQQQRQIINEYKSKAIEKIKNDLANKFEGFSQKAELIKAQKKLQKEISYETHFGFLERLKSIHDYKIEGKKIFLKFNLKLVDNPEQKLQELAEYVVKKRQQQIRLEQEKKNQTNKKKKQSIAKKKKGQKQQEEIKPVIYDFDSLLDNESWNAIMETLKVIIERQPYLLVIGCNYGPRKGVYDQKYSVKFLLQHIRKTQPSIQFMSHNDLHELPQKIAEQQINEGSIYLTQNINFLPSQVLQKQICIQVQPATQQNQAITSTKIQPLLMSQIRNQITNIDQSFQLMITEERSGFMSGLTTYTKCDKILGTYNWKYLAMALRTKEATLVMGGDFNPKRLISISRAINFTYKIYLTGNIGLKFFIATKKEQLKLLNVQVTQAEKNIINLFIKKLEQRGISQKLIIPDDFKVCYDNEGASEISQYDSDKSDYKQGTVMCDIGEKSLKRILQGAQRQQGQNHFFLINRPQIVMNTAVKSSSFIQICRDLYKKQQKKRQTNAKISNPNAGIHFENQLIVYLAGIRQEQIQKIELVYKPQKQSNQDDNQDAEEPQQENDQDNETKKIDHIADYKISDSAALETLLICQYDASLKDIARYPKSN